jgi:hypothetical protein
MNTFDEFFKGTKKTMEKLRFKINQIDTDGSGYEEKHDNRCESMINVIAKVYFLTEKFRMQSSERRWGLR